MRHDRARFDAASRIRLGYLSSDFHGHPVAYLTAEIFELHDRGRFEVFLFSYGPDDGSAMRRRLAAGCDRFIDLAPLSDDEAAMRIRDERIHILVDLKGYTADDRPRIAAARPAPIQVNWLGYPGTMGATGSITSSRTRASSRRSMMAITRKPSFACRIATSRTTASAQAGRDR
jgi:predicted O-linked N-acetylglucosamine transferase (SPINDLY family)